MDRNDEWQDKAHPHHSRRSDRAQYPLGATIGPRLEATARILPADEQHIAQQLMDRKYGWQKRFFGLLWHLQRREQIYIEITPTQA